MSGYMAIVIAYVIIGIVHILLLFKSRNVMSPEIIRHPTFFGIVMGILYQPIISIKNYFRNYRRGRAAFFQFFWRLLFLLFQVFVIAYIILLITNMPNKQTL